MKHKVLLQTIASCITASLLAGTAIAGPDSPGAASDPTATGASQSAQPPAPASSAILTPTSNPRSHSQRLSQLMGSTVKDQDGNTLGQINDFVVNPMSGRIQFAVVSLNDQAGKLTAVPWQLLKQGSDPTTCTLRASKDKLGSAQNFDASSWPDFNQPATEQEIYSHYGVQPDRGNWNPGSGNENGSGASGSDLNKSDSSGSPGTGNTSGSSGNSGQDNNPPKR